MPYAPTKIPGFRVALAIASLPGMTFELCCELWIHHTLAMIRPTGRNYEHGHTRTIESHYRSDLLSRSRVELPPSQRRYRRARGQGESVSERRRLGNDAL